MAARLIDLLLFFSDRARATVLTLVAIALLRLGTDLAGAL